MKAVVSSVYIVRNGEVESSSVVLHKGADGLWKKWDAEATSIATDLKAHSYFGLRELFEQHMKFGWNLKKVDEHHYAYGTSMFWVPCWSTWMLRRDFIKAEKKWSDWCIFGKNMLPPEDRFRTVKTWKVWIEANPGYGWRWSHMRQRPGDMRTWEYDDGKINVLFWFPELSPAPNMEIDDVPLPGVRIVCVSALGCAWLTEGKVYESKGEVDGLLQVVDDEGTLREFLPERFEKVGV